MLASWELITKISFWHKHSMQWLKKCNPLYIGGSLWTVKRAAFTSVSFFIWNSCKSVAEHLEFVLHVINGMRWRFFLSFINYTIKVSGPAWFSKICGFQISSAPVQERNCFQAVLFKEPRFHFIFYLMLLCHLGPVSSGSPGLQLFDRRQPVTVFSLVFPLISVS